eukprot:TRINITY_DN11404_c0_g2_i3.p1 TRINITY_DN11404_c0_g2~~TRINITY_DN11404_c0_g2_i3.p1  ORF type:complete len:222 (-),score=20.29 TRINITY_DN11404_c0_g2_i3:315-980(-)
MHHEGVKFVQIRRNTTCSGINDLKIINSPRILLDFFFVYPPHQKDYIFCLSKMKIDSLIFMYIFLFNAILVVSIVTPGFSITAREPDPPTPNDFTAVIRSPLKECLDKKADFIALGLTHYSYDIQRSCFCFPEGFTQLASVSVCGGSQTEPEYYQDHNTMIKVFDYLCDAIVEADSVDVTYDNMYHFPTSIFVDCIELAIDDEMSYSITNFQVLTPDNCVI